jgi:hypothetical protein
LASSALSAVCLSVRLEDSDTAAIFILRAHKPELYARHAESVVAAKAEDDAQKRIDGARQRLIQLGYLPPLIEGDYEEVNATPTDQP